MQKTFYALSHGNILLKNWETGRYYIYENEKQAKIKAKKINKYFPEDNIEIKEFFTLSSGL